MEFDGWLRRHESGATVGYAADPARCPLATWVAQSTGARITVWPDCPVVGGHYWAGLEQLALPDWADTFSTRIDERHAAGEAVTAKGALAAMRGLRRAA
jgi:hypothetical protein